MLEALGTSSRRSWLIAVMEVLLCGWGGAARQHCCLLSPGGNTALGCQLSHGPKGAGKEPLSWSPLALLAPSIGLTSPDTSQQRDWVMWSQGPGSEAQSRTEKETRDEGGPRSSQHKAVK